jgi:integrase
VDPVRGQYPAPYLCCRCRGERPLLLVLLNTLGGIDEILRLRWEDVDFEKRSVTLWTPKRKGGSYEGDQLPMNDHLFGVLWSLWESRAQNGWVF